MPDIIWAADFTADPTEDHVPSDVTFTPSHDIYDRIVEVLRDDDDRIYEVDNEDRIIEVI